MKKISIITLHRVPNYGSVLQAYASEVFFRKIGYDVQIIDYCPKRFNTKYRFSDEYKRFTFKYKNPFVKTIFYCLIKPSLIKQEKTFNSFIKSNLTMTKRYNSIEELERDCPISDYYCSGSDQIWNYKTNGFFEKPFYLTFVNSKNKFAFSSSFGRPSIDLVEQTEIIDSLKEYSFIGVREKSGLDILKKMNLKNTFNSLDPTLAIDPDNWLSVVHKNNKNGNYVLIYEFNKSPHLDEIAKEIAEKNNLKIIRIGYWYHKRVKKEKTVVCPSVFDFLNLIYNSKFVITNSFHATVFSVVFRKEFVTVLPKAFGVRIIDFLKLLGLEKRNINNIEDIKNLKKIDYDNVQKILSNERKKTQSIIKKYLGGE